MKKIMLFSLLGGFVFLLSSCEKDGALGGMGEKVTVNFSLGDIDYKGDETVTRGYAEMEETVRVPLGDGVFMFATLEEDLEAPTRAGIALEDGVIVRIVAYNETTAAETSMEYTVVNGALTTSTAMTIETGDTYTFVAYSYNSDVSPTYPGPTITVASPHDLLWGSASKPITPTDNSVYITLSHKFAQVKVKATTEKVTNKPVIKDLTGVTVTPGNPINLTIKTGAVAKNAAAATQAVSTWNDLDTKTVTSDPITVYTGTTNPIYVNISSVTIDGYLAFTGIKAEFKKRLTVGTSYTLVVNFQKTIFAKSNIYWKWNDSADQSQGGSLTFDTQENGHQGYQGVFFKWGSLVGVGTDFVSSKLAYKAGSSMPVSYSSWDDIPYQSTGNDIGNPNTNTSKGDICKYINSGYRLSNIGECGVTTDWTVHGNFEIGTIAISETDGTYDFLANNKPYAKSTVLGDVILPASGDLYDTNGAALFSGWAGNYWHSTRNNHLGLNNSGVSPYVSSNNNPVGFSVRCVQN
jgi:hypothetical protein